MFLAGTTAVCITYRDVIGPPGGLPSADVLQRYQ